MDRFWSKVDKSWSCWIWTAALNSRGYGNFWLNGKVVPSHRFSYEAKIGKIGRGLVIDHLCRNPACVNPSHLEPVTVKENAVRGLNGINSSSKTHCPKGHEYSGRNVAVSKQGGRRCQTCCRWVMRKQRLIKFMDRPLNPQGLEWK